MAIKFKSYNLVNAIELYNSYKNKILGSRLANIRQSRGFTQDAIAKDLKMSVDLYSKYEQGRRRPKDDGVKKISERLAVSPLAILEPIISAENSHIMHALFELERLLGISVKEHDGDLEFDFSHSNCDDAEVAGLKKGLEDWAEMRMLIDQKLESASEEEAKIIKIMYQEWQWNYPRIHSSDILKEIDRRIKESGSKGDY